MDKTKALLAGIFAGLSSSASYSAPSIYQRSAANDVMRMRSDVSRVGGYFKIIMTREYGATRQATQ